MMYNTYLKISAITLVAIISTASAIIWMIRKSQDSLKGKKGKPQRRKIEDLKISTAWEKVGKIKSLWIYPVKSCAGVSLKEALMEKDSIQSGKYRDRCFVISDEKGNMITARMIKSTLFITPEFDDENYTITLKFPDLQPLKVNLTHVEMRGNMRTVKIWNEVMSGLDCGDEAKEWLTRALSRQCLLLYYGLAKASRTVVFSAEDYPLGNRDDTALYTDSDAYLLINDSSILDLEKKTSRKHPPQNFRPNILVEAFFPYDEDDWSYIKMGEAIFRNRKPCPRCIFPTIDFRTGERDLDMEPLRTLRRYRCDPGSKAPGFGIYLAVDQIGQVRVGDDVFVFRN